MNKNRKQNNPCKQKKNKEKYLNKSFILFQIILHSLQQLTLIIINPINPGNSYFLFNM